MSVAPSETLERSVLEGKDREQLLAIAAALGVKPAARAKKADIIDKILEQVGVPAGGSSAEAAPAPARKPARGRAAVREADAGPEAEPVELPFGSAPVGGDGAAEASAVDGDAPPAPADSPAASAPAAPAPAAPAVVLGPDGEPLAEWELELAASGEPAEFDADGDADGDDGDDDEGGAGAAQSGQPGETREGRRRRRRRNRNRGADGEVVVPAGAGAPGAGPVAAVAEAPRPQAAAAGAERHERAEEPRADGEYAANEPVAVGGYVDLREEGFGFLRVRGFLATKDDIYVSVKQVRQYGLRKGDHVEGTSRAASRNEKNPALLTITAINGADPEAARSRRRFDDLTPVFPRSLLRLASDAAPEEVTARAIDLLAPIGKGQRGLVLAPPRSGKTTVLRELARAVERNHPDVTLIVVLVDERPEEVTEMRRVVRGEVVASTFDGKPAEHTQVAEMAVEKAKRLVEGGADVVMIVDGLTRLARAYNLSAPATGKVLAGGIDAGALHPTKRLFGAARCLEEGGSLTVLATALVGTGSKLDETVYEEFKSTATMQVRLDHHLVERRIQPAIDVEASSTRHDDRLYDAAELAAVHELRGALARLVAQGTVSAAAELLSERLAAAPTNAALLREIAGS